jgi:hypothetical protein
MVLRRAALALLLLAAACSPERGEDEFFAPGGAGTPVVDAMLTVGRAFPDVYLTRTLSPNEPFSYERAGILNATVMIDADGQQIPYGESAATAGRYVPISSEVVWPNTTYRLSAELEDGRMLRATTTTPDTIRVRNWVLLDDSGEYVEQVLVRYNEVPDENDVYSLPSNRLTYTEGLLEVRFQNAPAYARMVGLQSLDIGSELLIDADFLEDEDLDNFTRANQSPPFDAIENYLRIPWFAVYYQGRYKMRVFSMDRNWYDLARTDPVLGAGGFGFGGEAGDNTIRPIFHVDGGVGLFGSMSVDSVGFYVNAK